MFSSVINYNDAELRADNAHNKLAKARDRYFSTRLAAKLAIGHDRQNLFEIIRDVARNNYVRCYETEKSAIINKAAAFNVIWYQYRDYSFDFLPLYE